METNKSKNKPIALFESPFSRTYFQGTNIALFESPFSRTYFHGTKSDLKIGDFIKIVFDSNNRKKKKAEYIHLTTILEAAIWGAEVALGEGRERIYLVEPTEEIENDPDITAKNFPGNPTMLSWSIKPFKVVGEVSVWQGHSAEQVKRMKKALE